MLMKAETCLMSLPILVHFTGPGPVINTRRSGLSWHSGLMTLVSQTRSIARIAHICVCAWKRHWSIMSKKTPRFPCPECLQETTSTTCILCDLCNNWIHTACIGMNEDTLKKFQNPEMMFLCMECAMDATGG